MLLLALSCGPRPAPPAPVATAPSSSCTEGHNTPCDCRAGKGYQTCEAGELSECICYRGQNREVRAPIRGDLERYAATVSGNGPLRAEFRTSVGSIHCELFAVEAPLTVANFVGLALGAKPWLDLRTGTVKRGRPYYDGLSFHRVVKAFVIQGGDPLGDGTGGPGFVFQDETERGRSHARIGTLAMANRNEPDTNGSQFYITLKALPQLDRTNTVFGQCANIDVINRIGRVPTDDDRPRTPVIIEKVRIYR